MQIEELIFSRKKPNFSCLLENGFVTCPEGYIYSQIFGDSKYQAEVFVTAAGNVSGKVLELESGDEFLPLRVEQLKNETVQRVREEYAAMLYRIAKTCFTSLPFLNAQSNRITSLICKRYGAHPDFPWNKFPAYGVFRHQSTSKWYGLIMDIPPAKLFIKAPSQKFLFPQPVVTKAKTEIINLKIPTDEIAALHTENGIFPAYHLNAKHWISVLLEDILPDERIAELLHKSYNITVSRK